MPTVAVGGGYSWNTAGLGGLDKDDWTVTGTVSWSIWDGGTTDAKIKSASSGLKSAEETLLKARESIELEIRQDYLNILSAREQIRATEATVEQAEEAYKIATVRYRSGVGINLDVLDAQLALNKARTIILPHYIITMSVWLRLKMPWGFRQLSIRSLLPKSNCHKIIHDRSLF